MGLLAEPRSQMSTSCASASHPSLSSGDMPLDVLANEIQDAAIRRDVLRSGPRVADLGQAQQLGRVVLVTRVSSCDSTVEGEFETQGTWWMCSSDIHEARDSVSSSSHGQGFFKF